MNVFEKILEEILQYRKDNNVLAGKQVIEIERIIRSYMTDGEGANVSSYSRWIPVSERLPEPLDLVVVTVHTSEWIADYDSNWVPDEEKTYHPGEYNTRIGYKIQEGNWIIYDETGSEVCCEEEFGTEKEVCYDVVTAWQPLPKPHNGGQNERT